jgi:hypothetical protein
MKRLKPPLKTQGGTKRIKSVSGKVTEKMAAVGERVAKKTASKPAPKPKAKTRSAPATQRNTAPKRQLKAEHKKRRRHS